MSDIDRLRAAADKRERQVDDSPDVPGVRLREYLLAEAALLRAVADEQGHVEWVKFTADDGYLSVGRSQTWTTALALADVILGVTDG